MTHPINVETDASVTVANTSTAILAANTKRSAWLIKNTGAQTVYVKQGGGAATTSHFPLAAGESLRGNHGLAINGIVASGTCTVWAMAEGDA